MQRAEAAGDKGWLRVIAEDLRGLRFQWDGLRRVARAQWSLKDLGRCAAELGRTSEKRERRRRGQPGAGEPVRA